MTKKRKDLWVGLVHLRPYQRGKTWDFAGTYSNIITWASDRESYGEKVRRLAAENQLFVVDIEDEEPISDRLKKYEMSDDLRDLISKAETNPSAILFGTFHTYLDDE